MLLLVHTALEWHSVCFRYVVLVFRHADYLHHSIGALARVSADLHTLFRRQFPIQHDHFVDVRNFY